MTSPLYRLLLGLGALAGASTAAPAQDAPPPRAAEALRVFLDCRTTYCDFDYVRTEINFVNYVRDPVDAQIFVLVAPPAPYRNWRRCSTVSRGDS